MGTKCFTLTRKLVNRFCKRKQRRLRGDTFSATECGRNFLWNGTSYLATTSGKQLTAGNGGLWVMTMRTRRCVSPIWTQNIQSARHASLLTQIFLHNLARHSSLHTWTFLHNLPRHSLQGPRSLAKPTGTSRHTWTLLICSTDGQYNVGGWPQMFDHTKTTKNVRYFGELEMTIFSRDV